MREQCEPLWWLVVVDHMRPLQVEENSAGKRYAEHKRDDPVD
tara:strand:- start:1125 stop:1250 length:126 start_codon:yes stop_codon:yes gene_type:complete